MTMHRIRGVATLLGVSALVLAGPTAAAVADSDLQTFDESQEQQQAEGDREWSVEHSDDAQSDQESQLGSLTEQEDDSSREATNAEDTSAEDASASGPGEDFCDEAFGDNEDAHAQCMQFAEAFPSPEEGDDEEGAEEEDPFQQFCDEVFGDNEDAHAQCTEFAGNFSEDEGDGDDDTTGDDDTDGGEDDTTDDGGESDNPFQQFCDEAFGDNEDAHAQCSEFASNFEDDGGDEGGDNPFQQFCDEAFADNEDAHAQCSEFAQALGGEDDEPSDDGGDDTTDEEDTTDGQDQSGTLAEDQTASPAADDGALPVTGLNLAVAGLSSLSLLGLGGALLRRFRADSLG